jgi:hypothetical protein
MQAVAMTGCPAPFGGKLAIDQQRVIGNGVRPIGVPMVIRRNAGPVNQERHRLLQDHE